MESTIDLLPQNIIKSESQNPKKMIIFSNPKVGKTTLVSKLENALILDLENGSNFVDAKKINVKKLSKDLDKSELTLLAEIAKSISERNKQAGKYVYDYIVLDTVTALEDVVKPLALRLYNDTPMGKAYKGNILSLPNGGGYQYLREAFEIVYNSFDNLSNCLILLGHIKKASIAKDGKELGAKDLDLTGKLKQITCSQADAIGYLFRKDNKCYLSFKTDEQDLATGARPEHLRQQEFMLSEYFPEKGEIKTYWDKIFIK